MGGGLPITAGGGIRVPLPDQLGLIRSLKARLDGSPVLDDVALTGRPCVKLDIAAAFQQKRLCTAVLEKR